MQPAPQEISTCSNCGGVLEQTPGGGLGCMSCLLRAGIGSEEEGAQHSTSNAFEDGGRFGVYEIDRREDGSLYELGRGAMGVTYRATDTSLQRKVALKIIKIDIAERSADARERFMREARAAAALRHENIATIHQFGMRLETGQYFYAMELIEGETLEERVRRAGPLDARNTIEIAQQVTSALAAAEKHGLVHRDLKPANLMLVSSDGETAHVTNNAKLLVKIIDFGLAKAVHTATDPKSLTHDRFVGTPAFASPEQFEHSTLDVRSDIYSLGETLWFALTGKSPFAGHTLSEIHRAQKSDVLPTEQLKAAHVPHRLKSLLESMLAFEPASRPGTSELAARLQRCSPEALSKRRMRVALVAATLLVLAMSALFVFQPLRIQNAPLNPAPDKSIAVLPFENLSPDPENAYFADGIQEEILTRLAKIADLKVISRTSTQRYQSKPGNLAEIAKQLGVANILEGSVQKAGETVRVSVNLIQAATDSHLWADTYDRKLIDIFGVESEIAKTIAESLQAKLTGREEQDLAVKPTNNPEAYDAYLRGLAFETRSAASFTSFFPDLLEKAADSYERAVALDPNFALAWARLSRADAGLYFNYQTTRGDAAKSALKNAQKLEPNSSETLLALGYYQFWVLRDFGLAKITFEGVRKMLPGSSEVLEALGTVSRREGNWDQSIAYFEQAFALDPRNVELLMRSAITYGMLRQFPASLKLYDRVLDIKPNDPDVMAAKASIYQAQGNLQEAARFLSGINGQTPNEGTLQTMITQLQLERNYGEAVRLLQARLAQFHFTSQDERVRNVLTLALTQHLAGDRAGAKVTAEQAHDILEQLYRDQPDNADLTAWLSQAYAVMGERDLALKAAERSIMLLPRAKDPMLGPTLEGNLALIQTIFGENSRAISTLTQLLQTPYKSLVWGQTCITPALLRLDPVWDPLRSDPRFQELCKDKTGKGIAVLPFLNESGDPRDEYFSDGLSEELIAELAQIRELKVIGRSSSFRFKERKEESKTIGEKLGVATLLDGTVRKQGERVRIVVELINAADGIELWTQTFDRELKDIFAVQEEIAKAVAESLKVRLLGSDDGSAQRAAPNSVEAYNAYLQGHFYFERRNVEDYRKAITYFDRAIELDPNYALAYAERSETWTIIGDLTGQRSTAYPKARSDAEKAVVIAPALAETHGALGWVRFFAEWKFAEGLSELKRATELSPGNPTANDLLARAIAYVDKLDEAEKQARHAAELDPLSAATQFNLGRVLFNAGKLDEAAAAGREIAELQPFASASHRWQVLVAVQRGDGETALREAQLESDDDFRPFELALAYYVRGDRKAADAALANLIANSRDSLAYQVAEVYAVRGELDKAFEWLQIAFDNHDGGMLGLLVDPLLRGLRDDTRYKNLLAKLGLPAAP
jgi:TolB-like protein/predicted Zn-dependent protease/predicted Ser/Thr protein kinase